MSLYFEHFAPAIIAAIAISALCSLLSVIVIAKRLAFIGQGVSHAALGGVGVAAIVGLAPQQHFLVVAPFCILTAIAIAWLSDRERFSADAVIGAALVGTMALGALLISIAARHGARRVPGWEELMFGSVLSVGPAEATLSWIVFVAILGALIVVRRPLLFWTFDEQGAEAFGSPTTGMRMITLIMLGLAIVIAMRLVGVVLATGLLVLPGAAALKLTTRLGASIVLSLVLGQLGLALGLWASFSLDLPPGACIALALLALFALSPFGARLTGAA